jgi:hypothetical protein
VVRKREVFPEDESPSESCLHCEINDLVQEYVEGLDNVDIAEVAARMAESVVDLILLAPEDEQAKLLAAMIGTSDMHFSKRAARLKGPRTWRTMLIGSASSLYMKVFGPTAFLLICARLIDGASAQLADPSVADPGPRRQPHTTRVRSAFVIGFPGNGGCPWRRRATFGL